MTKEAINQDIEFVSDPTGYHVNVPKGHTGTVYFVVTNGVADKTCFDNFERADKRWRYFKYHCGGLNKTYEVAKCSLHTWKKISGYHKARNGYPFLKRNEEKTKEIQKHIARRLRDCEIPPPEQKKIKQPIYKDLYFVECEQPGESDYRLIKVGVSERPEQRVKILQIGCPFDLQLIHKVRCHEWSCSMEKWLHQKMEKMCQRGEWFKLQSFQFDIIKNFLDDDRVLRADDKRPFHARDKSNKQKKWDKIWEEHFSFSNRDWLILTEGEVDA
jgi:hypothetical protein